MKNQILNVHFSLIPSDIDSTVIIFWETLRSYLQSRKQRLQRAVTINESSLDSELSRSFEAFTTEPSTGILFSCSVAGSLDQWRESSLLFLISIHLHTDLLLTKGFSQTKTPFYSYLKFEQFFLSKNRQTPIYNFHAYSKIVFSTTFPFSSIL